MYVDISVPMNVKNTLSSESNSCSRTIRSGEGSVDMSQKRTTHFSTLSGLLATLAWIVIVPPAVAQIGAPGTAVGGASDSIGGPASSGGLGATTPAPYSGAGSVMPGSFAGTGMSGAPNS